MQPSFTKRRLFAVKQRKIRFEDDATHDPSADEKDTRPRLKPAVSALQVRMLQMAKMEVPMIPEKQVSSMF